MTSDFVPLFRNRHVATIAGNYWRRRIDETAFPGDRKVYKVAPRISVVAYEHQPSRELPFGQIVILHGLEGSSDAGYVVSLSQAALCAGFGAHRLNMRSCGNTEDLSETMYHSGLTSDTIHILRAIQSRNLGPIFLVGFSLGGNVALKLAGELGRNDLLCGVCAVSTPIDLASAVKAIGKPENVLYARRFLARLKARIRRKSFSTPHLYRTEGLKHIRSIWEFDDRYTAPLFGFGTAQNYYDTQSALNFLHRIEIPTMIVTAKNDPLVPFAMYQKPVFRENASLELIATDYGGHLGFLSRVKPRFWLDEVLVTWIKNRVSLSATGAFRSARIR